jgi:phage tail P2-like protein
MISQLLPNNQTPLEGHLDNLAEARLQLDATLTKINQPYNVPMALLPWVGWGLSLDAWDPRWSDDIKRAQVATSLSSHKVKGSVASVYGLLHGLGYGDAQLTEGDGGRRLDGSFTLDGTVELGGPTSWAEYSLTLERPITIKQKNELEAHLLNTVPARSTLKQINFSQAAFVLDGTYTLDGNRTLGVIA